ncbi:hypothetical protein CEXT_292661 [Caerostris extrusa]|uniref:Uncharacterized protein n=1 Tax=Caerostris extrusa TaxID=172846 RepID=A0AAV4W879_CAEEX|nr:hypothetical protein CEXT_292661 [Caerostris extrusa]
MYKINTKIYHCRDTFVKTRTSPVFRKLSGMVIICFQLNVPFPVHRLGLGKPPLSRLVRYVHLHINIENSAGVCNSSENIWLEIFPQESAYLWKRFHWSKTNTNLPIFISANMNCW